MKKSNYTIQLLNHDSIEVALKICDTELGKDYLSTSYLSDLINNEKALIQAAFNQNNELIGFSSCMILTNIELKKAIHSSQFSQLPSEITYSTQIGITNTIVIKNEYKNQGIGTVLFKEFLTFFEKNKTACIVAFAWKNNEGINMGGIFEKHNFKILKSIKNYWSEESIENNYNCPSCGNPPCFCTAVIYNLKS